MPKPSGIDSALAKAYAFSFALEKTAEPYGRDCQICDEPLTVAEILLDHCTRCGAAPSCDPSASDDDLPF